MQRLLWIAWAALMLVSCHKDADLRDLTAWMADQPARGGAKVYVDADRYACWHHGDAVNVNGVEYTLSVAPGGDHKVAKILGVLESDVGYTAAYPAANFTGITAGGISATATVPSVQTYSVATVYDGTGETYQQLVNPMVAHCEPEEDVLKFHNVACVLKVVVKNRSGYDLNVHYATLTAENAYLAGSASVSGIGTDAPSMEAPTNGSHDITVDCNSIPVNLDNGEDTVLYVVSAPFENQNLMLQVLAKDPDAASHGDTVYYTLVGHSASPLSLTRNQMGVVEFTLSDCGCADETGRCDYLFWGCGTEAKPFIITNKDDLLRLRNLVAHVNMASYDDDTYNKNTVYYKQILDIDISSETNWGHEGSSNYAIGYSARPFMANYNGSNHSVTMNINMTGTGAGLGVALFGHIGKPSVTSTNVIRNVVTRGSVQGGSYVRNYAGLVGFLRGTTRIVECVNYASVTNNYSTYEGTVGGICANIGWHNGGSLQAAGTVTFENCANYGLINNTSTKDSWTGSNNSSFIGTGGICGDLAAATSCRFISCRNYATVQGVAAVGGILGYCRVRSFFSGNNCNETTGTISASKYSGGVLGYAYGGTEMTGTTCNKGRVVCASQAIGGLVGVASGPLAILGSPRNEGHVSGSYSVGGILGWGYNGTTDSICNAINTGRVEASSNPSYVGGIVGRGGSSSSGIIKLVGCRNETTDSIIGVSCVGGILGYYDGSNATSIISSCANTSVVKGTKAYAGGVLGEAMKPIRFSGTQSNSGDIYGLNYVGGIVGMVYAQVVFLEGSLSNTGAIEASNNKAGGIIGGSDYTGEVALSNATNAGTVKVKGSMYAGGIIGYSVCSGFTGTNLINQATGTVTGNTNIGGIMGVGRKVELTSCKNYANVECWTATYGQSKGGIVGQLDNGVSTSFLDKCVNTGTVKSGKTSGESRLGGMIGSFYPSGTCTLTISNCVNSGDMTTTAGTKNGGLIGYIYRSGYSTITVRVYNSYSTGTMKGGDYTSGLVGYWGVGNVSLTNCYFNGTVTSTGSHSTALAHVGTADALTNCYACNTTGQTRFYMYGSTGSLVPPSNSSWFEVASNPGDLTSPVTIGSSSYSSLGDAIRAWQTANSTYTSWTTGAIPTLNL